MPVVTENLVELADLAFSVVHFVTSIGEEIVGPYPARVTAIKMSHLRCDYVMTVDVLDPSGCIYNLKRKYPRQAITCVRYQVYHFPSHTKSAMYEHDFAREVCEVGGIPQQVGRMKLYPVEEVWPELYQKGWGGQMLQFHT